MAMLNKDDILRRLRGIDAKARGARDALLPLQEKVAEGRMRGRSVIAE